jgi:hypothetical protein
MATVSRPALYAGRLAALGTMHGKEAALAPPLRQQLGLDLVVPAIDTDRFGTFTGETPRIGTMRDTAIGKARAAMAASGLPVGLASEGSFGPHPSLLVVPAAIELLAFVDDERDLVVAESLVSVETNFSHALADRTESALAFLGRCGFPDHAVIVRASQPRDGAGILFKGIRDPAEVLQALEVCKAASLDGKAQLETDMRAHLNPTRMRVLQQLAAQLSSRMSVACPACNSPGFGLVDRRRGLPCGDCGEATPLPLAEVHGCASCSYVEVRLDPTAPAFADPKWCPACNP